MIKKIDEKYMAKVRGYEKKLFYFFPTNLDILDSACFDTGLRYNFILFFFKYSHFSLNKFIAELTLTYFISLKNIFTSSSTDKCFFHRIYIYIMTIFSYFIYIYLVLASEFCINSFEVLGYTYVP